MRYCTKKVKDFVIFTIFVDSGWGEVGGGGGGGVIILGGLGGGGGGGGGGGECVIILGDLEGVRANLPLM